MKYLFLFLLLTACTAPKAEAEKQKLEAVRAEAEKQKLEAVRAEAEKQKADAIRADAMASADRVLREMNEKDATAAFIAAYKRTNTAPDPKVLITNHLDELEWINPLDYTNSAIEEPDLLDAIPFIYAYDKKPYPLMFFENPISNEYEIFFSNQLVKYGRDIQGRRIINRRDLDAFEYFSIPEGELSTLYRYKDTPYTNEYQEFFSNQLLKYGRDEQGSYIINRDFLYRFERKKLGYK